MLAVGYLSANKAALSARNAARNLNPDRPGPGGGAGLSGVIPVGEDGNKSKVPARTPEA